LLGGVTAAWPIAAQSQQADAGGKAAVANGQQTWRLASLITSKS
jgi:hypothetical protein